MKNKKNAKKAYVNIKMHFLHELAPVTRDVTCSKYQRYGENICDKKLSVERTLDGDFLLFIVLV